MHFNYACAVISSIYWWDKGSKAAPPEIASTVNAGGMVNRKTTKKGRVLRGENCQQGLRSFLLRNGTVSVSFAPLNWTSPPGRECLLDWLLTHSKCGAENYVSQIEGFCN
ncbi:hypothetical protein CEXT_148561 [Caerostris extrusa]|uniref:Uncharacterized protein n=1 Tax=Caerostris extrusa TaxID=172846 RepID=A0AAV4V0B3_CAEEX|nr:hypothetical protein CEXT_148561 [Caerostris extrusa]